MLQNALNWHKRNSWHVSSLQDSDSSVFDVTFLHLTNLASWRELWAFRLGKPLKNLCSSHCLLSKTTFLDLKVSVAFFLGLRQDFTQTCCSFKSANFYVCHLRKWNTHLYLMRHSSTITCAIAFQAENYISDYCICTQLQKFEVAAVSFTVSPETVWSHHIFRVRCLWCSHSVMSMTSPTTFFLISVFSIRQPTYNLLCTTYILSCESLTNVCYLFFIV
jgi:hypothetical protein